MSFWTTLLDILKLSFRRPPKPPLPPTPPGDSKAALIALMNAERARDGLPPFVRDSRLDASAQKHSDLMASVGKMSHQLPGELPFEDRIREQGYHWSVSSENVAAGQKKPEQVISDWMDENPPYDGHRRAILGYYQNVGCGMAYNPNSAWLYYWTADFGTEFKKTS